MTRVESFNVVSPVLAHKKPKRKRVPIAALHCPKTEEVFQWRGELSADTQVTSPSGHVFMPLAWSAKFMGELRFRKFPQVMI